MSNSKRILAALLAGAMVLCAGCGKEEETEEESSNSTAVEVTDVTSGAMSSEYTLNGKIAAVNEVQVFPLLAGQVQTLNVSEGDTVSKGQTLFTVDTSTVTSTMSSLQQSYSATKTATDRAIESAKVGVEQAELAVSNTEALLEAGAAAEQDLTKAKQAEAQQSASLAQIQASMDQINKQASLGTVTAPCSGTVTAVNVDRGGMASSAQPSVVIAENGAVEVQVSVAEDVFTGIKVGDTASVTVSAVSKESMNGTVSTLPAAANAQTNLYDVSVSLPSGTKPPIGAFATVTFYTDRRASTISVPTESILTGNNNEQYVFTVNADGTAATRVTVTTGLVTKDSTEIVSGLKAGDRVVTKGQSYLSDGAAVHVVTSDAADGGEG